MEAPKITRLPNGFTVVTHKVPSEQTYVGLDVAAGARSDPPGKEGLAHFVEHMLCKQTKNWDMFQQIEKVKDAYGYSNAYTSMENTHYYYHVNRAHAPRMVKMLADSVLRVEMTPESVKNEAETVTREVLYRGSMSNDDYSRFGGVIGKLAFASPSRLDVDTVGTPKTIRSFTAEDVKEFIRKHYTPERMTLVAVGDVDHDAICRLAEKEFGGMAAGRPEDKDVPAIAMQQGFRAVDDKRMSQIIFGMAFPVSGTQEGLREGYKNTLLSLALGGDLSSPLYRTLRHEKGMVYLTSAAVEQHREFGSMVIHASFDPQNSKAVASTVAQELAKLPEKLTKKELEAAKRMIIGNNERRESSVDSEAAQLAAQVRNFGTVISLPEKRKILDSITVEELQEHARKVFSQPPVVAVYGKDASKFPSYTEITAMLGQPARRVGKDGIVLPDNPPATETWAAKTGTDGKQSFRMREKERAANMASEPYTGM